MQVIQFIVTLAIFLILDTIWLGLVARNFYAKKLGFLMRKKPIWWAALLFYLLAVLGVVVFVLPIIDTVTNAFLYGALFGLISYATYDLTNYATIDRWDITIVIVDLVWGSVLLGLVSSLTFLIFS